MKIKYSDSIRVALFAFFGFLLMYIVYSALTRLSVARHDSYHVKALFTDLKQLQIGDDVRVAGVRVGSIVQTYLNKDLAVAVLSIEKKYAIPEDSTATILMAGLLGANYISIIPGDSEKSIQDSAFLKTKQATDISSVVQKFSNIGDRLDRVLAGFDGSSTEGSGNLFQDIGSFFKENRSKLDQIIDNFSTISGKIANGEGTLGRLVCEDQAHTEFVEMVQSIKAAANNVDSIFEAIKANKGLLGKIISDPEIAQSFEAIMKNIEEFSAKLNNEKSTLGRIISEDRLYKKAESALDKVEKAVDNLSNSGPVTAVGAAASALF